MKKDVIVYVLVFGLSVNEDNEKQYGGVKLTIGQSEKEIPYEEVLKLISKEQVIQLLLPLGNFTLSDISFLTLEEYEEYFPKEKGD